VKKTHLISIGLTLSLLPTALYAQPETQDRTSVNSPTAARKLIGKHKLNLQWIGSENWAEFGNLKVTDRQGIMVMRGNQTKGADYLQIDGKIISIEDKQFTFKGKIVTQVSHINKGEACEREGEMVFKITENRKYWRLQQMQNPCDTVTDYVDIFIR
jgi:PDZ domain-containing secreted protein